MRSASAAIRASHLDIDRVRGRSVVSAAIGKSPLRLHTPVGGGHAAWVFQSSLGGGFVGHDEVALRVDVRDGAALFLSSQASTKVYRGTAARCTLDAAVGARATLVAWPDPVTCFAGASFDQTQRFALAADANLIAVDAWTAGRVARGERWAFARLATRVRVTIAGDAVLDDALLLSPAHGDLTARLGGADAFATIAIAGPALCETVAAIARRVAVRPLAASPVITASRWPWGTVVRIAARDSESLAIATAELLRAPVTAILGADPLARKW